MVLPDWRIRELARNKGAIFPFREANLQPSSYDVTLGRTFRVFPYLSDVSVIDPMDQELLDRLSEKVTVDELNGNFLVHPGEFVLGVTQEIVHVPNDLVCRLEGKSSFGRLGLAVHITAGYIDPGFHGCITLEMVCFHPRHPIALKPGMPIAQIGFIRMEGEAETPYRGRYQEDTEATGSRYGVNR